MLIGEKIAQARKNKHLTQEQLAELMSVTRQSVSRWESGQTYPDMDKISPLADLLGVSCDYLLHDQEMAPIAETQSRPAVTRLLRQLKGKTVKLTFYDGLADADLATIPCVITEFDGDWMHVSYTKKKQPASKLLPVSSVLSITCMKEEE